MSIASLWLSHLVYTLINAFIRQTSRYNPALVISVWICFPLSKAAGFRSIPWLCTLVWQIDIPMGTNMNTLLIQIVQQIHWCSMNLAGISMLTMPPLQPEHHKMHLLILCCIHDTLLSIFECLWVHGQQGGAKSFWESSCNWFLDGLRQIMDFSRDVHQP
jgi:hypothetical protein